MSGFQEADTFTAQLPQQIKAENWKQKPQLLINWNLLAN